VRGCHRDDTRCPHPGISVLSEDEADDRLLRQGSGRPDEITVESHIVIPAMMYLPAFSDFLFFQPTCEGPGSATVCAESA
jgi:hypothetical protein